MSEQHTLATLPNNDVEAAMRLARRLRAEGKLNADALRVLVQSQRHPEELLRRLVELERENASGAH